MCIRDRSWTTKNPHGADRWLVKCRPVGGVWYIAATVTFQECIVSNLQPNTTYEFYVYSEAGPVAWVGLLSFPSETITITTLPITADLSSSALQAAFYNATRNDEKDYDGVFGLQCVDLYRWFVDTYTSLHGTSAVSYTHLFGNMLKTFLRRPGHCMRKLTVITADLFTNTFCHQFVFFHVDQLIFH